VGWVDLVAKHLAERLEVADADHLAGILGEEVRMWSRVLIGDEFRRRNQPQEGEA
jgi:hypothetical protein